MTEESNQKESIQEQLQDESNKTQFDDKPTVKVKRKKSKKQSFGLFETVVLMVILTIMACLIGYVIGNRNQKQNEHEYVAAGKELQTFIEQYNYILEHYYGDVDKEKLIQSAVEGMLNSLDEYSGFLDNGSNSFSINLEGTYEGVGIEISNDEQGNIVIRKVYEGTPAEKANLQVGDFITKFDNMDLTGKTSTELVEMIKNTKQMNLTIQRNEETLEVTLKKEKIVLTSVFSEMLDDQIGYVRVTIFANNTYEQFKNAIEELERSGMKKLIIDVRSNGGGYLTAVDSMLSLFMDSSHVIYQTDEKGKIDKFYSRGQVNREYPIVVLQNNGSASASEVLASSLKDNLNAYIIGNKSYGKGTVQQLQTAEGIGKYKVTTKKWLTPNGDWIHEKGIEPDLEVSLDESYLLNPTKENDKQLQAALEYLKK